MRLDHATWPEVAKYLETHPGIFLPTGSTEQHGPMGLIGTDALCAQKIARRAAKAASAYVAPTLAYTPAPFNTAFPGTISISEDLFEALALEVFQGLHAQGFTRIYVLNGHGANLGPLKRAASSLDPNAVKIRSWWDYAPVNSLRQQLYQDWEGMHATPSEVAITQATVRIVEPGPAQSPPERLSPDYIAAHAGDRHGPPDQHRADFPDGRVGSHSALARPEHGRELLSLATTAAAKEFQEFAPTT
jgi:creatinine amidohydrolase